MRNILILDNDSFIDPKQAENDLDNARLITNERFYQVALNYSVVIVNGKLIKNRFGSLNQPVEELLLSLI